MTAQLLRTVAIIPARGGSRGVPRKNLQPLGGKPLIAHSIEAALMANTIDAAFVSTEDAEIAATAARIGAQVIDRPTELATDAAQNDAVTRHALEAMRSAGHAPEWVVLLQPTSPLRRAHHIDGCLETLWRTEAVSAMSVCPVDHHPGKAVTIAQGLVTPFTNDRDMEARRQDLPEVFRQNGAIYAVSVTAFLEHGHFYIRPCAAFVMDTADSIDIDTPLDLEIAARVMDKHGSPP